MNYSLNMTATQMLEQLIIDSGLDSYSESIVRDTISGVIKDSEKIEDLELKLDTMDRFYNEIKVTVEDDDTNYREKVTDVETILDEYNDN